MSVHWSLDKAYSRNLGLISHAEQQHLAQARVVIPGCGGIGSTVAETLARLGVGRFRLSDPDTFDVANFNRQLGATLHSVGQSKSAAVAERILSINPTAEIDIVSEPISKETVASFIKEADVVLDGIDFFALSARRALFAEAYRQCVPAMTAAPLGFSATLQVYLPEQGMSFDRFFNFKASDNQAEQLTKFLVGLAPKALQRPYMDMSKVDIARQAGPSSILGTQLASVLVGAEVIRLLLARQGSLPAPWYRQFDAYRQIWIKRYLPGGNRHPVQKLKLALARKAFQKNGLWDDIIAMPAL